MESSFPTIEQIQDQSLLAGFNEKQQAFVDKLIAEYLKHFRGVKDSELKDRFEKGDREALKIYREMIARRQQILDFINEKDEREKIINLNEKQKRFESFEVGDKILIVMGSVEDVREATITAMDKTPGHEYARVEIVDDPESIMITTITNPDLLLHFEEDKIEFGDGEHDEYQVIREDKIEGLDVYSVYTDKLNKLKCQILGFGYFYSTVNVMIAEIDDEFGGKEIERLSISSFKSFFKKVEDGQD